MYFSPDSPAFPTPEPCFNNGITIRAYMAMKFMEARMALPIKNAPSGMDRETSEAYWRAQAYDTDYAIRAVEDADTLIKALNT